MPSSIALVLFAYGAGALGGPIGIGLLHGLKLVAVAIVAQAVWGMARTLCPDRERASIAVVAALLILFSTSSIAQIAAIVLGGIAGLWLCRAAPPTSTGHISLPVSRTVGLVALTVFFLLLVGLPVLRSLGISQGVALFEAFYRSGALVFGGGHVVLPLLREAFVTPGWVSDDDFLAGYGAAQAVPGPLFTFAAYLGAVVGPSPHGLAGAAVGLIAIFLPGGLILMGTLPFWETFRKRAGTQAMMRGVNAAVVGLLGAALYNPVWTSSIKTPGDFGIALVGFVLLTVMSYRPNQDLRIAPRYRITSASSPFLLCDYIGAERIGNEFSKEDDPAPLRSSEYGLFFVFSTTVRCQGKDQYPRKNPRRQSRLGGMF